MQQTTNYNLLIPEGTDVVNPLTQVNPNFQTIDGAMFANKQASIGTASEVVTGTVHAIIRNNADSDVFRFTATGAWTAGDTMTLDGQSVTVHLSDGTTPATNSYIIGAEVLAMVNGSLVTLAISSTPPAQGVTSFNSRTGAVVPAASDYDGSMIDYDNTGSGLNATDVQGAIDELAAAPSGGASFSLLWTNPDLTVSFTPQTVTLSSGDYDLVLIDYIYSRTAGLPSHVSSIVGKGFNLFLTVAGVSGSTYTITTSRILTYVSDTSFTAGDAYYQQSNAARTTNNDYCVPYKIYGIKF